MKAIIAIDSFKGCLSSVEAEKAAFMAFSPEDTVISIPLSDGGEGFFPIMSSIMKADTVSADVHDPLFRPVTVHYGFERNTSTAIVETAQATGLYLLSKDERDPFTASSYGTGETILDAIVDKGAERVFIGLGGSATNDGGTGLLQALGVKFITKDGSAAPIGKVVMKDIALIDDSGMDPRVRRCEFHCFYDVDAPFFGEGGATRMFGPQKGLKPQDTDRLDFWMESLCKIYSSHSSEDIRSSAGSGAAGGIGGAMRAVLRSVMNPGVDRLLEIAGFSGHLDGCSLVVTGEGRCDEQTLQGKAPKGVLDAVRKYSPSSEITVALLAGKVCDRDILERSGFDRIIQITPDGTPEEEALRKETASANITRCVRALTESLSS